MKKQAIGRRIWTLALALILAFQVAGVASAASVSWTSGSNHYTATVNQNNGYTHNFQNISATKTAHTKGFATRIIATASHTVSSNWSGGAFPSEYSSYLTRAMHNEGLYESATYNVTAGSYVTVPPTAATGNYVISVGFERVAGIWSVVVQSTGRSASPNASGPTGSIPYALTRANYFVTYSKV